MENNRNKLRTAIRLMPEIIDRIDEQKNKGNCKNRNDCVEQALEFYLGYLESRDATPFLSEAVLSSIQGTIQSNQNRVANNLFRLSVELNMMMNLLGSSMNVPDETMHRLRGRCVKEVKETRGKISFHEAMKFQNKPQDPPPVYDGGDG